MDDGSSKPAPAPCADTTPANPAHTPQGKWSRILAKLSRFKKLAMWVLGALVTGVAAWFWRGWGIVVLILIFVVVVASAYQLIWLRAREKKDFAGSTWGALEDLKDASSYFQSFATALILIGGAGWGVYTWLVQDQSHREGQVPALQVRIHAEERKLEHPDKFALTKSDYLIDGWVTIKNVGTSKTSVRLCECAGTGKNPPPACGEKEDPQTGIPTCPDGGEAKGPLVVSKASWSEKGMQLQADRQRFWLLRPSIDKERSDIEPTDEMRPNAKDKFEFLVTVPGPGVYAIMFTAPIDQDEFDRMKKAGYKMPDYPLRWDTTTFLEIK